MATLGLLRPVSPQYLGLSAVLALGLRAVLSAAEPPVPLWPGVPPGEKAVLPPEHDLTRPTDGRPGGRAVIHLNDVSNPTLTVYPAPADKSTGATVVVFPGGGYQILAMDLEGTEVCDWLNSIGVTAVLVKYRVPPREGRPEGAAALEDGERALGIIRSRASEWGIDPSRIGVLGFSAGGNLAAALSASASGPRSYARVDGADDFSFRPDFQILIYPAWLNQQGSLAVDPKVAVDSRTPPTFLVMAQDDPVHVESILAYGTALQAAGVPMEMHVFFARGGHGYGLRPTDKPVTGWPALAAAWLRDRGLLSPVPAPVPIAVIGLVHDHARAFIPSLEGRRDIVLAGVVETEPALIAEYSKAYHIPLSHFYPTLEALEAVTKVKAAAVFTSTYDHRAVVEKCAALGIDAMMEKPMATSLADAKAMAAAARKAGTQIFVNYETSWYPSNASAYRFIHDDHGLGAVRKILVYDGHQGPAAIGCSPYFLKWLTDPVLNGGGALMDFGTYGADLVTWLMGGKAPLSVYATTAHLQPNAYPNVDDESTIVIEYPRAQAIIQASWDWPYDRKDMEVFGQTGSLRIPNRSSLLLHRPRAAEVPLPTPALQEPYADPASYLAAVARGEITPSGLASVETNLVVCAILDAARESARTGRKVFLDAP